MDDIYGPFDGEIDSNLGRVLTFNGKILVGNKMMIKPVDGIVWFAERRKFSDKAMLLETTDGTARSSVAQRQK